MPAGHRPPPAWLLSGVQPCCENAQLVARTAEKRGESSLLDALKQLRCNLDLADTGPLGWGSPRQADQALSPYG